ncbi:hypothetical protein BLNAU_11725 [Blattamonas nauphoetae]|uniref:HAT C-terminal dimerisation domain-containing protein n=1 Tax=Blattamonas nauphoetae TaxID=2049346 RepID=A0ABQ9XRA4_9EUKA|nr:hypothetical protein BLNAU_11725 [Blattamonas nauphoetae]
MQSVYRVHCSTILRSPTSIVEYLLREEHFKMDQAMFGLLKVMLTISATTVDTEREFSTVHRTKRKDRTNLTTHHVESKVDGVSEVLRVQPPKMRCLRRDMCYDEKCLDSAHGCPSSNRVHRDSASTNQSSIIQSQLLPESPLRKKTTKRRTLIHLGCQPRGVVDDDDEDDEVKHAVKKQFDESEPQSFNSQCASSIERGADTTKRSGIDGE